MIEFLSTPFLVTLAWLALIGLLARVGSTSLRAHRAKKAPAFGSKRASSSWLGVLSAHYLKIVGVALSVGGLLSWTLQARDIQRDIALRAPDQTRVPDQVIEFDMDALRKVDMNDPEAVEEAVRTGVIPTIVLPWDKPEISIKLGSKDHEGDLPEWREPEDRDAAIEADAKRGQKEVDRIKAAHDALPDRE